MDDPVGPMTFAHNPLSRVSWLRQDRDYIKEAYLRDDARFVLINNLDPFVERSSNESARLLKVKRNELGDVLPRDPFEDESARGVEIDVRDQDTKPLVVFLGVEEDDASERSALPEKQKAMAKPRSPPLFAVDVSQLEDVRRAVATDQRIPLGLRTQVGHLPVHEAAIAGLALIDWNRRTRFCAGCGRPVVPIWAGWKRTCRPHSDSAPCPSDGRVQNYTYPRTDGVIIVAILHPSEDKILLGRQRVWPAGFVSCLAGFLEPGESLEEATVREVYEEAGVKIRNVRYLRSQPWPFPNSLMCGLVAEAEPNSVIRTDLDNELESAEWYSRSEILAALDQATGFTEKERNHIDANYGNKQAEKLKTSKSAPKTIRLPPVSAIAHHLIKLWAMGEVQRAGMPHTKM